MKQGIIHRLLDYYLGTPEYKEEMLRALSQFFNRPKLSTGDRLEIEDKDEGIFNEWLMFNFRLKNKKTLLEDFCQRNPCKLSATELQAYYDLQENEYGLFEVLKVEPGKGLKVKNLKTGKEYEVKEFIGTFQAEEEEVLIARVGKMEDHFEFVGRDCYKLPAGSMSFFLSKLASKQKLNPKITRDFFKQLKEIKKKDFESIKGKLLDGGKCICDLCGKKGKMGALTYDKKTGEPIVICYKCDLKIKAQREGITIKEAEKRRKRMFEVSNLFQYIKIKEYLDLKNKREFDSIEEANRVSKRIMNAWNNLSIKQRKDFDAMDDKELRRIYENIPVDFSDL
ncbi:MAG: hypothetical protein U9R01_08240 [candidate division WOR-3 bacterium]|nr:hypothetical protein [candidate division WOR-3 bacterium]